MQSPVIKKILLFGVISGVISLMLACVGFGIVEFYKIKEETITKINSQMDILAFNLQAPLLFDDKEAANKILLSLKDDKSIIKAILYQPNGRKFAVFVRQNVKANIRRAKNISYDNKIIGRLEIDSVYLGIREKYRDYLWISLLIIIISIPASYFISKPIRDQVSQGVIQLQQLSDRLRLLTDQVLSTEQRERKRIAAIIHDHLQQLLVASKLQLSIASRALEKGENEKVALSLKRIEKYIDDTTLAARTLTVELRPPVLYEAGLPAALQWLVNKFKEDHNMAIVFQTDQVPIPLSDTLKIMVYESVKELLLNVVKYAGVQSVDLSLKYHQDIIVIIVKDKGSGFDVQRMEEKTSLGKGFGLFSIRERLKLIDGNIKIISQPGQGTEIQLTVPVRPVGEDLQGQNALLDEKEAHLTKGGKKVNILLVDDHKIVREGIANILNENSALNVIAQAEDGIEAVQKAELFHPDVVVMDINMPRLNGIEATRAIKTKFPNMNIIGLSVQDEKDISESMKEAGAVTLLNKAGDPQDLVKAIMDCKLS